MPCFLFCVFHPMFGAANPIADVFVFGVEKLAAESHTVPAIGIYVKFVRNIFL